MHRGEDSLFPDKELLFSSDPFEEEVLMKYKLIYMQPLPLKDDQKVPTYERKQEIFEAEPARAEEDKRKFLGEESVTCGLVTFHREQITFMPTLV